jgi:hypothetical protein
MNISSRRERGATHMAIAWCGSSPVAGNSKWSAGNLQTVRL